MHQYRAPEIAHLQGCGTTSYSKQAVKCLPTLRLGGLILSLSSDLDIYLIFARRLWPMFLKAHLAIPYASLNHLYQTSCRIRLWFILFCFSFFTKCLCIFTQFVLFFLPNYRFEISTITEQLCYYWCHTKHASQNKPAL